ncbi:ABC transporter ATP-binding protein [Phyllobacterium sp. SB3]|uniref:ABC transporter ATP-binding protein n=1 Tax=Phyllobacterium sp. SB3 TaxID=3156073 RepID=UPI0032AEAB94
MPLEAVARHVPKIEVRIGQHSFPVRNSKSGLIEEFTAIQDLHLKVQAGEFLTIVGPSGCGKTTLLDIMAGLSTVTDGYVSIDGVKSRGPSLSRGIVFQQYALLPWRTALANVEFSLEAKGGLSRSERQSRALACLSLVGLDGFETRYPHELSGGMKQRVAIARSLVYEPDILLMDEPFGALDAQTRELLQDELVDLWKRTGKTIVFITHSIDEAVRLGERVAVMRSKPGSIETVIDIDLPQIVSGNEVRAHPSFSKYRNDIWSLLRTDDAKSEHVRNPIPMRRQSVSQSTRSFIQ